MSSVEAPVDTSESRSKQSESAAGVAAQALPKLDIVKLTEFFTRLAKIVGNGYVQKRIDNYVERDKVLSSYAEVIRQLSEGGANVADAAVRARQLAGKFRALEELCKKDVPTYGTIRAQPVLQMTQRVGNMMKDLAARLEAVQVPYGDHHDPWGQSGVEISEETLPPWVLNHYGSRIVDITALERLMTRAPERFALFDDIVKTLGDWSAEVLQPRPMLTYGRRLSPEEGDRSGRGGAAGSQLRLPVFFGQFR